MFSASFTVGAVCVIDREDGARLLVRQAYRNGWGLPGGLIKRGEEAVNCVRREVFEEVGLRVKVDGEPAVVVDPGPQRVDVVYKSRLLSFEEADAARPCSPEIDEVGWFAVGELPELQHETVSALVALTRLDSEVDDDEVLSPSSDGRTRGAETAESARSRTGSRPHGAA